MGHAKWLDWTRQLQAIAQTGRTYATDVYDIERYAQLLAYPEWPTEFD